MSRNIYTRSLMVTINNGEFPIFTEDVNILLESGKPLRLNLYTTPDGSEFALDISGNPIQAKLIIEMDYVFSHNDLSDNPVDGYFLITFDDGNQFNIYDGDHHFLWYSFEDLNPTDYKQFT